MIDKEQLLSIERPKAKCVECDTALDELNHHPTRLRVREDSPERADFCADCWEFAKGDAYDSFWVTRRIKKEKRIPKLSRREKAVAVRALFESLWERRDDEDVEAHLYFLSHLLLRWGGLKWVRNKIAPDGGEIIVFENPATGDPIEVRTVDTSSDAIAEVKTRIENFLREYAPENDTALD